MTITTLTDQQRYSAAERMVGNEVIYCVSELVSDLAKLHSDAGPGGSNTGYTLEEDVYPLCSRPYHACPECGGECSEGDDPEHTTDDGELVDGWRCRDCGVFTEDEPDTEHHEAYEHWIVSDWLAGKLEDKGEITGELHGLTIWGRCCTGQAVALDGVIQEIALEAGYRPEGES